MSILDTFTTLHVQLLGVALIVISLFYLGMLAYSGQLKKMYYLSLLVLFIIITTFFPFIKAYEFGYTGKTMTLNHFITSFQYSMENTNELKNGIPVVLFKFGCPDCMIIYDELKSFVKKEKIPIQIILSQTNLGKTLCEEYEITNVPTLLYIKNDKSFIKGSLISENNTLKKELLLQIQKERTNHEQQNHCFYVK